MMYKCPICQEEHNELPDIGSGSPYQWADMFKDDPASLLTEDLCVIEGRDFFIRGVIEIPVFDFDEGFGWGVWISHKKENFEAYRENFETSEIGPFFGWLCTEIDYYPESTLHLKTMAHYLGGKRRPRIVVEESNHPLSRHQQDGISLAQAWGIAHFYQDPLKPDVTGTSG